MSTEKKKKSSKKGKEKSGKEVAVKKEKKGEAVGKAKYDYPKNCTTDADKKKYRSMSRAGKAAEWAPGATGGGKSDKKKKDPGTGKAVILDGKGKKIREEDNAGGEVKKKKKKKASSED